MKPEKKEKTESPKGNRRFSLDALKRAFSDPRNSKLGFLLADGEYECVDADLVDLKAKNDSIPGMRVKSKEGKWISIYLSSLVALPPFPVDDDGVVVVPYSFILRIKEGSATIGL